MGCDLMTCDSCNRTFFGLDHYSDYHRRWWCEVSKEEREEYQKLLRQGKIRWV